MKHSTIKTSLGHINPKIWLIVMVIHETPDIYPLYKGLQKGVFYTQCPQGYPQFRGYSGISKDRRRTLVLFRELIYAYDMDNILKIDSVMYRVKDIEISSRFYTDTLGFKKVWEDREREMVGFKLADADSEIVLHVNQDIPNPDFSFLVEDVEKYCEMARSRGIKVMQDPTPVRCGKFAIITDPDGNRIPIIDLTAFGGKPKYD